jgi:hypothetical protein
MSGSLMLVNGWQTKNTGFIADSLAADDGNTSLFGGAGKNFGVIFLVSSGGSRRTRQL